MKELNQTTHIRITRPYLAKLQQLSAAAKRTDRKQLEWLIDEALSRPEPAVFCDQPLDWGRNDKLIADQIRNLKTDRGV